MIVALSGRKSSGKTTLADLLINRGFKQASFATLLKKYTAELFDWDLADLYTQSGKEEILKSPVVWDFDKCQKLKKLTGIELVFTKEITFNTRRDALQYIGTDIIREADPDFHVNKFAEAFGEGNYVVDDLRFANELNVLKNMKAIIIHIIRPYNWDYSNHDSEVSLLRKDIEFLVVNDTSHNELIRKFNIFLDCLFSEKKKISSVRLLEVLKSNLESQEYNDLNHDAFYFPNEESAYWAGVFSTNGTIKKHSDYSYVLELESINKELIKGFKNFLKTKNSISAKFTDKSLQPIYYLSISSPYIIDDLKKWNIDPKKSQNNKIPDFIENNESLICQWLAGCGQVP